MSDKFAKGGYYYEVFASVYALLKKYTSASKKEDWENIANEVVIIEKKYKANPFVVNMLVAVVEELDGDS